MKKLVYVLMLLALSINYGVCTAATKEETHAVSKKTDKAKKHGVSKKSESLTKAKILPSPNSASTSESSQTETLQNKSSPPETSNKGDSTAVSAETNAPAESQPGVVQENMPQAKPANKPVNLPKTDLVIKKATYGAEGKVCDATDAVNKLCANQESECVVGAGNDLCGDSVPGVLKELRVTYKCPKQEPKSVIIRENAQAPLACH